MKVLVSGGCGYIGSIVSRFLIEKKFDVVIVDSLENGHEESLPQEAVFYKENLCNKQKISAVFAKEKPDAVLHFAGYIQVGESVLKPEKYYSNNLGVTTSLLEAMIENNCKQIVFSSTAAVYGNPLKVPITENEPLKPINPYGFSKLFSEQMIKDSGIAHGINFAFLRYFNAAGAGFGLGESHFPETHLIPNVLLAAQNNKPVFVFGTDYETKDGTCVRDYVHVLDLASAHVKALDFTKKKSDFFNLGTNKGFTVFEIIKEAEKVTGKKILVEEKDRRSGDAPSLVASNKKAEEILKWVPEKNLHDIIQSAWQWQENKKY